MFSQLGWAWERRRTVAALVWSIGGLEKSTEFILFKSLMCMDICVGNIFGELQYVICVQYFRHYFPRHKEVSHSERKKRNKHTRVFAAHQAGISASIM